MAAPDKKKILIDLQKALTKSQFAKAVDYYHALIELDPDDFKLHNNLGDALVRLNKKDEAVAEFKTAAAKFAADGFIAQAMAIYQKSLKIKEDADVRLGMADIQASQGLAAEAKKNYLQVLEKYMQEKLTRKAVDVMQKMADLDPGNIDLRIKLARICEQEGLASKAVEEYRKAGKAYLERKETAKALSCFQKVIDALPDDLESKLDYNKVLYLTGKFREARDGFAALTKLDPRNPEFLLWEGKAAYRLEDYAAAEAIFSRILEIAPDRVETNKYLIRVYRKTKQAVRAVDTVRLLVDQLVTDKSFEAGITLIRETLEDFPGNTRMLSTLVTVAKLAGDRTVQKSSLEKLLAAAENEGDRRMAAGALNDLCVLEPDNRDYQTRLRSYRGEEPPVMPSHEEVGLVEEMEELELIAEEAEAEVVREVRGAQAPSTRENAPQTIIERTIAAPSARPPRSTGVVAAPAAPELTREQQEQIREAHTEVDVYLKYGLRESAVEALDKILSLNPADEKALDASVGLKLGIGKRDEALRHLVSLGLLRLGRGQLDLARRSLEEGQRIRKDDPALRVLEDGITGYVTGGGIPAAPAAPVRPAPAPARAVDDFDLGEDLGGGEAARILVEEEGEGGPDLEEADFYFRQGLFADALPIYQEYLQAYPDNVQVLERIEEIQKRVDKGTAAAAAAAPAPPVTGEITESAEPELELEELAGYDEAIEEAIAEAEAEGLEVQEEPEEIVAVSPAPATTPPSEPAAVPPAPARPMAPEEFFDLAAELDEEISQLEETKGANLDEAPVEDLESVFREFQEGVVAAIGEEDADTHYNLGIAYKEMGLFKEAVAEFGVSIKSPDRSWDSAVMMGICFREGGDFDKAIEAFTKALLISDRSDDEYVGLRYELAQVYEKAGKSGEALVLYREIVSRQKGFADVDARISRLAELEEDLLPEPPSEPFELATTAAAQPARSADEPVIAAPGPAKPDQGKEEAVRPKKNRVSYL